MDVDTNSVISLNNNDMLLNSYNRGNVELVISSLSLDLKSTNYPLKGNILPFFKNLIMNYDLLEDYDNNTIYENFNQLFWNFGSSYWDIDFIFIFFIYI